MITDRQVRRLRELLLAGETLSRAAWKTGMDRKTAGKYRDGKLPSERSGEHDWRTREDPFAEVWAEVHEQLQASPELQPKTLFAWLQRLLGCSGSIPAAFKTVSCGRFSVG